MKKAKTTREQTRDALVFAHNAVQLIAAGAAPAGLVEQTVETLEKAVKAFDAEPEVTKVRAARARAVVDLHEALVAAVARQSYRGRTKSLETLFHLFGRMNLSEFEKGLEAIRMLSPEVADSVCSYLETQAND